MQTYIVFLRGVMPTGKNKVPMGPLRDALTELGFEGVRTYIQSGNVLLCSSLVPSRIEKMVHDEILRRFGGDIVAVVRTPEQVGSILEGWPFSGVDTSRRYFVILQSHLDATAIATLSQQDFSPTQFSLTPEVAYLHCPNGYSESKLNGLVIEKRLGVRATMRNHNTLTRLLGLAAEYTI